MKKIFIGLLIWEVLAFVIYRFIKIEVNTKKVQNQIQYEVPDFVLPSFYNLFLRFSFIVTGHSISEYNSFHSDIFNLFNIGVTAEDRQAEYDKMVSQQNDTPLNPNNQ